MFLVLSFDFGGSSDVRVHGLTSDDRKAQIAYDSVCRQFEAYNEKHKDDGLRKLVDMIAMPDDFVWEEGFTAFWGKTDPFPGVQRLASNNTV